jgi:hypothetical protein
MPGRAQQALSLIEKLKDGQKPERSDGGARAARGHALRAPRFVRGRAVRFRALIQPRLFEGRLRSPAELCEDAHQV